jgi:hypothetical protein
MLKSFTYNLPDGTSISINVDAIAGSGDSGVLSETSPISSSRPARPPEIATPASSSPCRSICRCWRFVGAAQGP